jgi:hypothetical protein
VIDFDTQFTETILTSFQVMIGDVDEGDMRHLLPGKRFHHAVKRSIANKFTDCRLFPVSLGEDFSKGTRWNVT